MSAARAELSLRVVALLEEARREGPAGPVQASQPQHARRRAKMVYRPLLDVTEAFLDVGNRHQRRQHLMEHRIQWARWQASRREGDYPAAYSTYFLAGDFPALVVTTIQSDTQRRNLFKDLFAAFMDTVEILIPTITPTEKRWEYKDFLDEHLENEMKLGGTLPDSAPHHISVDTVNTSGMNINKMDLLFSFMDAQNVVQKLYGTDARREFGPNAVICAS